MKKPCEQGYSLIGVLAALVILSTIAFGLFRLGHHTELLFYRPLEAPNRLSAAAWSRVTGRAPAPDETVTETRRTIDTVTIHRLESEGDALFLVPAP